MTVANVALKPVHAITFFSPNSLNVTDAVSPRTEAFTRFVGAAQGLQTALGKAVSAVSPTTPYDPSVCELEIRIKKLDLNAVATAIEAARDVQDEFADDMPGLFANGLVAIVQTLGAQLMSAASGAITLGSPGIRIVSTTGEFDAEHYQGDEAFRLSLRYFLGANGLREWIEPNVADGVQIRPDKLAGLGKYGAGVVLGGQVALGHYSGSPIEIAKALKPFEVAVVTVEQPASDGSGAEAATVAYLGLSNLPLFQVFGEKVAGVVSPF